MLLGDMVVFAVFFGSYLVQLGKHPQMFATSQQELSQSYGVLNTLVLLASSLLVALGVRAVVVRRRHQLRPHLCGNQGP